MKSFKHVTSDAFVERFFDLHLKVYNQGVEYLTADDLLVVAETCRIADYSGFEITTNIKEMVADSFLEMVKSGITRDNSYLLPMLNTYNTSVAKFETNPRYDPNVQSAPIDPFVVKYPANKVSQLSSAFTAKLADMVGYVATDGKPKLRLNFFELYKLDTSAGLKAFITDVYIFNHDRLNSLRPNIMGEKSQ